LADSAGRVLGEGRAAPSNLTLGVAAAAGAILAAARDAFAAAGIDEAAFARTVAGLGLAGANVPALAKEFSAHPFPFKAIALESDAVTACLGAHGGEDGAILILGTGSQGLVMINGVPKTVGGWGFELSDDGSGAVLGRAAIRAAILAYDGIMTPSPMTDAILARFNGDPSIAAVWGKTATPGDYGAFATLVVRYYGDGDPIATDVMAESSAAVARLMDRLITLGAQRIALMGGLASTHRSLLTSHERFCVEPKGDALSGALMLAVRAEEHIPQA
jgi:glucosamine kinase